MKNIWKAIETNWLLGISVFIGLTFASCSNQGASSSEKYGFVNTQTIYDKFHLKVELEKKLNQVQVRSKQVIDSMVAELQFISQKLQNATTTPNPNLIQAFEMKRKAFQETEKRFVEEYETMSKQFTEQIWLELNKQLTNFAKEENYAYIIGSTGTGSLMYSKESLDVTEKFSAYLKEKSSSLEK